MSDSAVPDAAVDVAVDNDVLLKAACYGLALRFWGQAGEAPGIGVLGAARFVLANVLARSSTVRDKAAAAVALAERLARAAVLEPTDAEVYAAAELEQLAQRAGFELDVGESQLAVIVTGRNIALLDTGDKRAVRGFEALVGQSDTCARLSARVRCLEQILLRLLDEVATDFDAIAGGVCAEPEVDRATSISFSCYSGGGAERNEVRAALESYVALLRAEAPTVLAN